MQAITMERGRFYLEGVERAITANVSRRGVAELVLEQPLPFLRLDSTVRDESGGYARISRVDIALEDGVPRLVLQLAREPEAEAVAAVVTSADDTDRIFTPGVAARPARTDSTVPYDYQPDTKRPAGEVIVAPRLQTTAIQLAQRGFFARVFGWLSGLVRTAPALS